MKFVLCHWDFILRLGSYSIYVIPDFTLSSPFNIRPLHLCHSNRDNMWLLQGHWFNPRSKWMRLEPIPFFSLLQVSHHPPAAAIHVESKDWTLWSDITITSKFRGKYLQVFPQGITHIQFKKSGSHYTYKKVTSTVHNIIVGKLWVDTVSTWYGFVWPVSNSYIHPYIFRG